MKSLASRDVLRSCPSILASLRLTVVLWCTQVRPFYAKLATEAGAVTELPVDALVKLNESSAHIDRLEHVGSDAVIRIKPASMKASASISTVKVRVCIESCCATSHVCL